MDVEHDFNESSKSLALNCTLETIVKKTLDPKLFELDLQEEIPQMAKNYQFELDDF